MRLSNVAKRVFSVALAALLQHLLSLLYHRFPRRLTLHPAQLHIFASQVRAIMVFFQTIMSQTAARVL